MLTFVEGFQQRLSGGDVTVACSIEAHALLHGLDFIASGLNKVSPAGQFLFVDFKLGRILLDDTCGLVKDNLFSFSEKKYVYKSNQSILC